MSIDATVFVVDDDPAVRESLTLLLEQEDLTIMAFESAEAFLAVCAAAPGRCCVVADIRMPGMDGMQLQEELSRRGISLPLIFLTGHGDIPMSVRAIKAGAIDFLTKPITGQALVRSVREALGESDRLSQTAERNESASARMAALTEREREVMELAVQGMSNKEIARRLGISHRTVEIHKARVMHKTSAESLLELARIATAAGLRD
jgi:RNA polymerase sigma factor (sigma-70 family)